MHILSWIIFSFHFADVDKWKRMFCFDYFQIVQKYILCVTIYNKAHYVHSKWSKRQTIKTIQTEAAIFFSLFAYN